MCVCLQHNYRSIMMDTHTHIHPPSVTWYCVAKCWRLNARAKPSAVKIPLPPTTTISTAMCQPSMHKLWLAALLLLTAVVVADVVVVVIAAGMRHVSWLLFWHVYTIKTWKFPSHRAQAYYTDSGMPTSGEYGYVCVGVSVLVRQLREAQTAVE